MHASNKKKCLVFLYNHQICKTLIIIKRANESRKKQDTENIAESYYLSSFIFQIIPIFVIEFQFFIEF